MNNKITLFEERAQVEMIQGLVKTNMSYNEEIMLCHFTMKKGVSLGLHRHPAAQNGYVLRGKLKYQLGDENGELVEEGILGPAQGYVWAGGEYHNFEALEDSEFIECFSPWRPEYVVAGEKEA